MRAEIRRRGLGWRRSIPPAATGPEWDGPASAPGDAVLGVGRERAGGGDAVVADLGGEGGGQDAVLAAVEEVDQEPGCQPPDEAQPVLRRQREHQERAEGDTEDRRQGNERCTER